MPIDPVETDGFVVSEGETVRHLVGLRCWCVANKEGQSEPGCPNCKGEGYTHEDEKEIVGLITSISGNRKLLESGLFYPGDCIFSPLTSDTVSEHDKVIFTWPLPYGEGDAIKRGAGDYDTLYYEAVSNIYLRDEDKVVYKENIDFQFNAKRIEWEWVGKPAEGVKPATDIRYTVKYKAYIEWIAFIPPSTRISHGEDIGSKVFLRQRHIP